MTRPDPDGVRYARWWEPVLAPAGQQLLEALDSEPADFLDVGAGTGGLVLAAAARWPRAHIVGLDASAAMLSVSRARWLAERPSAEAMRVSWVTADSMKLPLGSASFDVVTSSFMVQLVDDRSAVLRELARVLRPGGRLGLAAWLAGEGTMGADVVFDEVLDAFGLAYDTDEADTDEADGSDELARTATVVGAPGAAEYGSVDQAVDELAAAGFADIRASGVDLRHEWTPEDYLDFKTEFEEHELFDSLDPSTRTAVLARVRSRWAGLDAAAFRFRAPIVIAAASRPRA